MFSLRKPRSGPVAERPQATPHLAAIVTRLRGLSQHDGELAQLLVDLEAYLPVEAPAAAVAEEAGVFSSRESDKPDDPAGVPIIEVAELAVA